MVLADSFKKVLAGPSAYRGSRDCADEKNVGEESGAAL